MVDRQYVKKYIFVFYLRPKNAFYIYRTEMVDRRYVKKYIFVFYLRPKNVFLHLSHWNGWSPVCTIPMYEMLINELLLDKST